MEYDRVATHAERDREILPDYYHLSWKDLSYTVTHKHEKTTILKGVNGYANSGEMLAIMGTSGSGKTSLLSILSKRAFSQSNVTVSGEVFLNSLPINSFDSNFYIKYVIQEDKLFGTLTVRECLNFAGTLKVPSLTHNEVADRVEKMIQDLGLKKVGDSIIGSMFFKGISGGEKRRVSIGCELISYPALLVLDEPTSGLDSLSAEGLIETLKEQARQGKMIICSIHQPSSKIFYTFDRLILMSEGHFIYQGPTADSVKHFWQLGDQCPPEINPPEFFMRLIYVYDRKNMSPEQVENLRKWNEGYKAIDAEVKAYKPEKEVVEILKSDKNDMPGFGRQLKALVTRSLINVKRQPILSFLYMAQAIAMSILILLMYNKNESDLKSVQSIEGVIFFSSMVFIINPMQAQLLTFPTERVTFLNEYAEGLYGPIPFLLSKIICEFPFLLIFTIIYTSSTYFVVPYNTADASKFFIFIGIALLAQLCSNIVGYMIGSVSKNITFAITIGPLFMITFILFGGFFSNTASLSKGFGWFKYCSALNYTYRALILNQFTDFSVDDNVTNPIDDLDFNGEIWHNAGLLLIMIAVVFIITASILKITGDYLKRH